MKKFIPYQKLSKKERRHIDISKRRIWNGLDPQTKTVPSGKLYTRKAKHKNKLYEA